MHFPQDELSQLAVQASTLAERLEGNFISVDAEQDAGLIAERLTRWRQAVAKGDESQFNKRLDWDGLTPERIHAALGVLRLPEDMVLPEWTETLNEILQSLPTPGVATVYRFIEKETPIPFEELLAPFVVYGMHELAKRAGETCYKRLSEQGHISLERRLLQQLVQVCIWPMDRTFSTFRARKQPLALLLPPREEVSNGRGLYLEFVENMLAGDFLAFLQQYPVLARLIVQLIESWCLPLAKFLQRLNADWEAIESHFSSGQVNTRVSSLTTALSDPHNGGQSVISVTFDTGLVLIYKPKNIGMEVAYYDLVGWLNKKGMPLELKQFKSLNRGAYGWSEFVNHAPCQDEAALKRYYTRAGLMLGLLYALNATDCHRENVIACSEYPVLIDMETLVYPRINDPDNADFMATISPLERAVQHSVQYTGFLPLWEIRPDGRAFDMSGLVQGEEAETRMIVWKHINTDAMHFHQEMVKGQATVFKGPYIGDDPVNLADNSTPLATYQHEIAEGFEQFYLFLLKHKETLLAENSPLEAFNSQPLRYVMRPTRIYGALFEKSLAPEYLASGLERSFLLESLARAFIWANERPPNWLIMRAEQIALEQLDIPFFSSATDSTGLSWLGGQILDGVFTGTGYERLIAYIQQLNHDDLKLQLALVVGSIYAHTAINRGGSAPTYDVALAMPIPNHDASDPYTETHMMVAQALSIAEQISAQAIQSRAGTQWLSFGTSGERYQFQPMGHNLYDGSSGVILFLAALEKITAAGYTTMIQDAMKPLEVILASRKAGGFFAQRLSIGGATGLGSLVYTLVLVSQFLNDSHFLGLAQRVAALITPTELAADKSFDVVNGAAGALLGLLSLYEMTAQANTLEQAIAAGEHLLESRVVDASGYRVWATINNKAMTGFSHGAAGIAYALLRLYAASGESRYREAAQEAISFEQRLFIPEANNWLDLRSRANEESGSPAFGISWCHGAPGIGLARLGGLPMLDTPEIRRDIDAALKTTLQLSMDALDHICCGILGQAETLLVAARILSRPELAHTARSKAGWMIRRAQQQHGFALFPNLPTTAVNLGFFQGTSGIGYELLRLAYPDALPSVLLWKGYNL